MNAQTLVDFSLPTRWLHGKGYAGQVGALVRQYGCSRPLLLTDPLLLSLGAVDPVLAPLKASGLNFTICDMVDKEPTLDLFNAITAGYDLNRFDAIIAVGGGSVIDVAKALAVIRSFGGDIRDYAGFNKVPGVPVVPFFAVPTTSGTGSEVSDGSVLIDEERDTKFLVISKNMCPTMAVTDPNLTLSMPPWVTACSGIDALVHASESYISKGAVPATKLFAQRAIELISGSILSAHANGQDVGVREKMQIGATMAMIAAMNSKLGLCHAMAMPLCGLYHMPHGQAVGMALPAVLRYNSKVKMREIKEVLSFMGFLSSPEEPDEKLEDGISALERFLARLGIAAHLNDFGFNQSHLEAIAMETLRSAQCPTNPRDTTEEDIRQLALQLQ